MLAPGATQVVTIAFAPTAAGPVTGAVTASRPRIPDQATYNEGGVFAQMARVAARIGKRIGFEPDAARGFEPHDERSLIEPAQPGLEGDHRAAAPAGDMPCVSITHRYLAGVTVQFKIDMAGTVRLDTTDGIEFDNECLA